MLHLPKPTDDALVYYVSLFKTKIIDEINNSNLSEAQKTMFKWFLEEIQKNEPDRLIEFHTVIMDLLIPGFNEPDFSIYRSIQNKRVADYSNVESEIAGKYTIVSELLKIFDYDRFISKSTTRSYKIANIHNRNTCTYCNRLYTLTVAGEDKNRDDRITRPEFDHWFPKSRYPILALSFYNLIPSCHVCNSGMKGNANFNRNDYTHPFYKEDDQVFKFSYRKENVQDNNVRILVEEDSKIDKTLKAFKIEEVYNGHSHLELRDLIELKHKYSKNYLDILFNKTFKSLKVGKKEAYRLVFGVEFEEEDFHKRPFSKFKKDILSELLGVDSKDL